MSRLKLISKFIVVIFSIFPFYSKAIPDCDAIRPILYQSIVPFYQSYSSATYMNLHCARNSKNFYEQNKVFIEENFEDSFVVYIVNQDLSQVIFPQSNRQAGTKRWTYHVILLLDGQVVDMDYREKGLVGVKTYRNMPALIDFESYLNKMWGENLDHLVFQVRPIDRITDLTEVEVDSSIRRGEYSLLSSEEVLGLSLNLRCGDRTEPYFELGADKPF